MIKITFDGGPGTIMKQISDFVHMRQDGEDLLDNERLAHRPVFHYESIESSETMAPNHIVTVLGKTSIACTCTWFRYNPGSARRCKHMGEAEDRV